MVIGTGTTGSCPEQKPAGRQTWLGFKGVEGKGLDLELDTLPPPPPPLRKAEGTTRPFLLPEGGFGLASSQNQANPRDFYPHESEGSAPQPPMLVN